MATIGTGTKILLAALVVAGLTLSVQAQPTVDGTIHRIGPGSGGWDPTTTTVDHIAFTVNTAGLIEIDLLSWEWDYDNGVSIDLNGDGEIAFIDTYIYLFVDDGDLDTDDYIDENDDEYSNGFADGSISSLDSYLLIDLAAGNYILAVGDYNLYMAEAVDGTNYESWGPYTSDGDDCDHGDYRVTFGGDVSLGGSPPPPIPEPLTMLSVFGGITGLAGYIRKRRTA